MTPNADLKPAQAVHVVGAGFPDSVVGICQGINAIASPDDCADGFVLPEGTSATGAFSLFLVVRRFIYVPSLGRTVDCAIESCTVAAGLYEDFANTVISVPITFAPGLADGRIKRRSDGMIFGDNQYFYCGCDDFPRDQHRTHAIAPGGYWTYALQVQNDGPFLADLTMKGNATFSSGAQFFVGYYDVTASVLSSSGFTFSDMTPGEIRTFALRFHAPADTPEGIAGQSEVLLTSGSAGITDQLALDVFVPTSN